MKSMDISTVSFAQEAKKYFLDHADVNTYTSGHVEPGCLFAVRWGLSNHTVLVFKLDDCFEPIVFSGFEG